jgi:hypothetical protein
MDSNEKANNHIHLTVKSAIFFAEAKKTPLFTSSDVGVLTAFGGENGEL